MHTNIKVALKPNIMSSLMKNAIYIFEYAFSSITLKILNLNDKSPKYLLLIYLL